MSNYCGYCGTATAGSRFCGACGRPATGAAADGSAPPGGEPPADRTVPRQAPASPGSPAPYAGSPAPYAGPSARASTGPGPGPWPGAPQPGVGPGPTRQPVENPFALTPVTDYVRDLASLVCLFSVLGMGWDFSGGASDRWWVVLGVLVAVLALPLPYLGRARLVPGVSAQHVRWAKAALTVPLWAGIVAALVNELINVDDDFGGGVGAGVAMAAAGALLVAQPRRTDESSDPRGGRGWRLAATASAVAVAVAVPAGFVAFVLRDALGPRFAVTDPLTISYVAVASLLTLALAVSWPAAASVGPGAAWKRVLATTGFATLAVLLVAQGDWSLGGEVVKWSYPVAGSLLLGLAAPLAVSRPVHQEAARRREPVGDWVATAAAALGVGALLAGAGAVELVLSLLQLDDVEASVVVVVVLLLACAVALTVAAALVVAAPRHRVAVLCLVATELLLTIVALSVAASEDVLFPTTATSVGALLALPVLAVVAVTAPPSVRRGLGPLVATRPTSPAGYQ